MNMLFEIRLRELRFLKLEMAHKQVVKCNFVWQENYCMNTKV